MYDDFIQRIIASHVSSFKVSFLPSHPSVCRLHYSDRVTVECIIVTSSYIYNVCVGFINGNSRNSNLWIFVENRIPTLTGIKTFPKTSRGSPCIPDLIVARIDSHLINSSCTWRVTNKSRIDRSYIGPIRSSVYSVGLCDFILVRLIQRFRGKNVSVLIGEILPVVFPTLEGFVSTPFSIRIVCGKILLGRLADLCKRIHGLPRFWIYPFGLFVL